MRLLHNMRTVVSTQWLREQLGTGNTPTRALRVLDTSFVKNKEIDTYTSAYLEEHIPQSLYFGLHSCVESTPEIPRNLPETHCFQNNMRQLGIWPDTHVVAYDRFGPSSAFRTWWIFRLFGHRKISVLDGGFKKWKAEGFETTKQEPIVARSDVEAQLDRSLMRTYDQMMMNIRTRQEQIADARAPDEPSVMEIATDGGKIPGAKHVGFNELFTEEGTIKSQEELKAMFDAAGLDLNRPMVASCFSGLTACGVAAAAHILGKDIPVYYGSWMEWRARAPEELKCRGCGSCSECDKLVVKVRTAQ
ncbi:THTR-like protein [Mya arenaria]|uniref:THTR-like protein n=1 Tax=Mya arenaria TaxID=6604 RepID=A0ABY7FE29_MYAAR|nr:thiosulfate sulfurtransferase-like [Mya arenaria]XP_052767129.1 thiosulfate sulfurtransferase-like [Mya arenaria]WAR19114.1 THTR-like protein [Mya arenaria]